MGVADFIGGRGEAIAVMHLARICRTDQDMPYFAPHFLGEKFRTFDFLVELIDVGETPLFFFVQVKSTRKWLAKTEVPPRLRVEVKGEDVRQMIACPIPTADRMSRRIARGPIPARQWRVSVTSSANRGPCPVPGPGVRAG